MSPDVQKYNQSQQASQRDICETLYSKISSGLVNSENKVWHGAPVWFLGGNPVVGYSVQKPGVRLMFWSGADFEESKLLPGTGKFKDASIFYNSTDEINDDDIKRWVKKSVKIQWDYKNIVKRKGILERIS